MNPFSKSVLVLCVVGSSLGCSQAVQNDATTEAALDAVTDVPADAGPDVCPVALPTAGTTCTREGLVCEYGTDPRRDCRPTATCTSGRYLLGAVTCPPPPVDTCPATRDLAAGQSCAVMDAYCTYGDLYCHCTNCPRNSPLCNPSSPLRWDCDVPNANPQCPAAMPRQGTACAPDGLTCTYACGASNGRTCIGGAWYLASGGPCPVSTRQLKRDIRYLDDAAIEALAADTLSTRLSTYEYTDPALAGRRHLGFIIEDRPAESYAVESSRATVDLYGYTSMVLATVQAQQRRIERLERELAALRGPRAGRASMRAASARR